MESELEKNQNEAKKEADLVIDDFESAFQHAIKCGKRLIEVKKLIRHGNYENWIKDEMPVSLTQCRMYVTLANEFSKTRLTADFSSLSIDAAVLEINRVKKAAKAAAKAKKEAEDKLKPDYIAKQAEKARKAQQKADEKAAYEQFMKDNEVKDEPEEPKQEQSHYDNIYDDPYDDLTKEEKEWCREQAEKNSSGNFEFYSEMFKFKHPLLPLIEVMDINPEFRIRVLKFAKQYLHPDKETGNEEQFKIIQVLK